MLIARNFVKVIRRIKGKVPVLKKNPATSDELKLLARFGKGEKEGQDLQ